jgi:Leucine-rich repeat (LRR) protein
MIQSFCSHNDLLALTSVDKTAWATRFCNLPLQKLCFKTVENTKQFLACCQASQEGEVQALIPEEETISRQQAKLASSSNLMQFISFNREHLQATKALTLTISDQFTAEQYDLLFTYLPEIQHLTIHSTASASSLSTLFKAAQRLTLYHLTITCPNYLNRRRDFENSEFMKDYLPNELWQFTTLEKLTIRGFENVVSISEEIGQLKALKSLELSALGLWSLPTSIGQLNKLEALTLKKLKRITLLPEEIGQLNALKSLTLEDMDNLYALPTSLWQMDKLEALTLENLRDITALPREMGQLNALKSLTLKNMDSLKTLPASLEQLSKLEVLTLEDLFITALEDIGQLNALRSLTLQNVYSPPRALPASLGQLDKLETLTLKNLDITDLPEDISQLNALKLLTLNSMPLLSVLPASLGQIQALKIVKLIDMRQL